MQLRAENERLKREVDYWMNLDAQALEAENERLRAALEQISKYPHITAQIAKATLGSANSHSVGQVPGVEG